jgi:PAS domain-containing protein
VRIGLALQRVNAKLKQVEALRASEERFRLLVEDDREHTLACWRAACADQGDYDLEHRIRRHDGVYHWFRTRGVPVRDEQGKIAYWFGTCTDIEDYKRLEAALREADRRKNEFLATTASNAHSAGWASG